MKRFVLALLTLFTVTVSASAMSYEQARDQALFLTDKMAYELNLTDEQYEAAYEINLDYLMRIDSYNDLYGTYWRQRNLDLSYILLDWQYRAYCDASYFYRPLYWDGGYWHFGIYARYPHRDYFFFGCPNFVFTYHGGHSWYYNGGRSWYYGRRWDGPRDNGPHPGMRARFDDGHFGPGYRYEPGRRSWSGGPQNGNRPSGGNNNNRTFGNLSKNRQNESPLRNNNRIFGSQVNNRTNVQNNNGNRSFGSANANGNRSIGMPRQSSTRTTVNQQPSNSNRSFGNRFGSGSSTPSRTFTPQNSGSRSIGTSTPRQSAPMRSFGGSSLGSGRSTGSFGASRPSGTTSKPASSGARFGRR